MHLEGIVVISHNNAQAGSLPDGSGSWAAQFPSSGRESPQCYVGRDGKQEDFSNKANYADSETGVQHGFPVARNRAVTDLVPGQLKSMRMSERNIGSESGTRRSGKT